MPKRARVFYAYPANPRNVGETISATVDKLKAGGALKQNNLSFRLWPDNAISGKSLVTTILSQIERDQIFACDLTYPNPNVSFELGYAIAKFKRIFASLNSSITDAEKEYRRLFSPLLGMGFTNYDNHEDLAESLLSDAPWKNLDQTLLNERYQQQTPRLENPTLLYIKPTNNSDSVIAIQEEFNRSRFAQSIITDDPHEYSSQPLEWYAEKILDADVVVVHLLSTDHNNHSFHNTKASIVAGLAHGLGRPMIMLAHSPYQPPIDYEKWLVLHDTAEECIRKAKPWLGEVGENLTHRRARRQLKGDPRSNQMDLRHLFLGDAVAEHESERLHEYFVETDSYNRALDDQLTILVGRRGTGKTAILYAIRSEMRKSARNHVTVLKPIGYETHGLIRVLEEIRQRSERGFLIESLWKYLIYSEIATDVAKEILNRPVYQERTPEELSFLEYCDTNSQVLEPPFSERIETAVLSLQGVGQIVDARDQRLKISEYLHTSLINELRRRLGIALEKTDSLTLLIDGLDEPWGPGEHIDHLAELIGGLLGLVRSIPNDFLRSSSKIKPVEAKITVSLRSDIFAFIQHLIPEQDKLPLVRITWNDREQLLRVLEERMLHDAPKERVAPDVWKNLFPTEVVGVSPIEFILRSVLPRPRDLIHMARAAVSISINRGHQRVTQDDLLTARSQYSQYAFDSILKEDDPVKGKLEDLLYEFAGTGKELNRADIESTFSSANVEGEDIDFYLDLLCDISFLAVETTTGFRYPVNEEERRTLRNVARVVASKENRNERFAINPAFYQVLQIE